MVRQSVTFYLVLFLSLLTLHLYAQGQVRDSLEANFRNPPVSARPKALWPWVNGNFSFTAITYEMEEAKEKGMGGFDIWDVGTNMNPQNMVPDGPPFLGDESLDGIAHAIREANRLGLELGLITSSSWNAGGSWIAPEHGAMGLFRSDSILTGPLEFKGRLPFPNIPGNYVGHKTLIEKTVNGLPVYYKEIAVVLHPLTNDSTVNEKEITILQNIKNNNDEVTVTIPKGKFRLVRYVCAPTGQPLMIPSAKSDGLMLDHFSAAAQEANMKYILERLKTKFPSLKGQSLKYLYEDSYEVNTAVWTPLLPEFFRQRKGYDIDRHLIILDGFRINNTDYTSRFQFDFNKVLSDMIIENHYAKGKELSEKEGLGFYAEAGGPGKPIHNVPFEDLRALGSLTVPRGEFWNKHPQLELLQIVKGIASAAHIYNQPSVEAESFTSVWLWQEGPDELKPLADRAMCEGLNRFVYHTFPHSTPEAGKPGWIYNFGTLINTTNGWWPKSYGFHEYIARCSYLLQQGNFRGDVAFYYGDAAPNFVPPKHTPNSLGKGYDYDVVNSDVILNRMEVRDGKIFLPHGQYYEVLVLPEESRINPLVLQKIEKMVSEGATVIGRKPSATYSLSDQKKNDGIVRETAAKIWGNKSGRERAYGEGRVVWKKSVRQVLMEKNILPDVEFNSSVTHDSCDFIHRSTANADIYFVRNKSKKTFTGNIIFRIQGRQPEWWNPVTGGISSLTNHHETNKRTSVPVQLQGEESAFFIFRRADPNTRSQSATVTTFTNTSNHTIDPKTEISVTLDSPWRVRFAHTSGEPTELLMDRIVSLHTLPQVQYFTGVATYSTDFNISAAQLKDAILLKLNKVEEIGDVYVNGARLGTHWHHTQRFDISSVVREGKNSLIIEVVNSINNGLVGDARRPEQFRIYKTNIQKLPNAWMKPFAEASLLPAGLIGPVEIISVNQAENQTMK
jgi:hypothetical protein